MHDFGSPDAQRDLQHFRADNSLTIVAYKLVAGLLGRTRK